MNTHDDPVQILRYIQNDLDAQELAEFSEHLRVCEQCRSRVEQELALSGMFRRTSPLYTAPAEFDARLAALLDGKIRSRRGLWAKLHAKATRIGAEIEESLSWLTRRWLPALCAAVIAILCVGFVRSLVREYRARDYVEAAVAAYRDTAAGLLPLQIRSEDPAIVTQWAGQRVSFHFPLTAPEDVPRRSSGFRLAGARTIEFRGTRGVAVLYHRRDQMVILLIARADAAIVAGGHEAREGKLLFHYRHQSGFNVTTWNSHGLSYALVSSASAPARQSCLVCHGALPPH